jgi:hypothetical protein
MSSTVVICGTRGVQFATGGNAANGNGNAIVVSNNNGNANGNGADEFNSYAPHLWDEACRHAYQNDPRLIGEDCRSLVKKFSILESVIKIRNFPHFVIGC